MTMAYANVCDYDLCARGSHTDGPVGSDHKGKFLVVRSRRISQTHAGSYSPKTGRRNSVL